MPTSINHRLSRLSVKSYQSLSHHSHRRSSSSSSYLSSNLTPIAPTISTPPPTSPHHHGRPNPRSPPPLDSPPNPRVSPCPKTPSLPHPPTSTSLTPFNSCYSAHEHSSTTATTATTLPLDIILETLIGATLLAIGIVVSQAELRPIVYKVWAGKQERETGSGPVAGLEERSGFLDIRVCCP